MNRQRRLDFNCGRTELQRGNFRCGGAYDLKEAAVKPPLSFFLCLLAAMHHLKPKEPSALANAVAHCAVNRRTEGGRSHYQALPQSLAA